MRKIAAILILLLALCFSTAEASSLRISAGGYSFAGFPGAKVSQSFEIENLDKTPIKVKLTLSPFTMSRNGTPVFEANERSLIPWLQIGPSNFTARPNVPQTVKFTLKVPEDTKAGSYFSALIIEEDKSEGLGVSIVIFLYCSVGKQDVKASIEGISYSDGNLKVLFKNSGEFHYRTKGTVELRSAKDGKILSRTFPLTDMPVLPNGELEITQQVFGGLTSGSWKCIISTGGMKKEEVFLIK